MIAAWSLRALAVALAMAALTSCVAAGSANAATFSNFNPIDVTDATGVTPPFAAGSAAPYPSQIPVSGLPGVVSGVHVTLHGVAHTRPDDLDILLAGPGGQSVVVLSDSGETFPLTGSEIAFDDAGPAAPDTTALGPGPYHPTNNFGGLGEPLDDVFPAPAPAALRAASFAEAFNGTDPNGSWSLYVLDDRPGETGTLSAGWSLDITTVPAAPAPPQLPAHEALDPPPVAAFTISPALPCTGQRVTFDASASQSYVGDGGLTYAWSIGALENDLRNPEDRFRASTGSDPRLTRTYGPLRLTSLDKDSRDRGDLFDIGGYEDGGIVYGKHYRDRLGVILRVTDEAGVTTTAGQILEFGDAGYAPYGSFYGLPPGPKPRCAGFRIPSAVAITSRSLVAHASTTHVIVRCPPPIACTGRVTLTTKRQGSPTLKVGSGPFGLAAGKQGDVDLKLSKPVQRLLQTQGRLRVDVQVRSTNQSGKTAVSHSALTLRAAGR